MGPWTLAYHVFGVETFLLGSVDNPDETAEALEKLCEIGTAGNSILNIANLHVIYSVKNCDFYEYWMPTEAHQFGLKDDITVNNEGSIKATKLPGIGYELDWNYLNEKTVQNIK